MPEIPEIETVRRHLTEKVQGKIIQKVEIAREKSLNVPGDIFAASITGQQVVSVNRRAKQIIIGLANNHSLVVHFMLEGYARFFYAGEEAAGTPSVTLTFHTEEKLSFFKLTLGYLHLAPTVKLADIPELAGLGPEPLSPEFSLDIFRQRLLERRAMIKPLLMNQEFIAGIGNVYSNETLFCSKIRPERKTTTLTEAEQSKLYHCIRDILALATRLGGVYEEKFAADDILTGGFEPHLKVAYRTGQPCYICRSSIETKRVGGRNAFYCPVCQR